MQSKTTNLVLRSLAVACPFLLAGTAVWWWVAQDRARRLGEPLPAPVPIEPDFSALADLPERGPFSPEYAVEEQAAITEFAILPASDIADQIEDDELVLGVVVAGEARAYPINAMTGPAREVFNDTLGDRAIAATW